MQVFYPCFSSDIHKLSTVYIFEYFYCLNLKNFRNKKAISRSLFYCFVDKSKYSYQLLMLMAQGEFLPIGDINRLIHQSYLALA